VNSISLSGDYTHEVEEDVHGRMVPMVRVMLADDQPEVRSALRLLLEQAEPEWRVVAEVADGQALEHELAQSQSDIVLLDWELPGLTEKTKQSVMCHPGRRIAVVVLSGRPEMRREALDAGADDFVSKVDHPEELLRVLQRSLALCKDRGKHSAS
jgi:DNA-binding NarL/FixJ family response regulator